MSLIASSIMSKLAAGADAIVLDVKFGSGAFMKEIEQAIELAKMMIHIGESAGKRTIALLSNMDQPLGYAVGNALEIKEAIGSLKNQGPEDLVDLCTYLASYMILLAKKAETIEEAFNMVHSKLLSGEAFEKFKEFVRFQGGDISVIDDTRKLPQAKYMEEVKAETNGYVQSIRAADIGSAALILGAGRERKESNRFICGSCTEEKVGILCIIRETIAIIHTNQFEKIEQARKMILDSFTIVPFL